MSTPAADMAQKHARILGELAEFGLDLARKLHDQGMAAETPEETADLARAFHSVSRSVRQTLALEAKLAREAARQDHDDRARAGLLAEKERVDAAQLADAPYRERKNRIGAVLERLVYSEYEDEGEIERLMDEIVDRPDGDAQAEGFLDAAIDDQIAALCRDFGLPLPERPVERRPAPPRPPDAEPETAYAGDWAPP